MRRLISPNGGTISCIFHDALTLLSDHWASFGVTCSTGSGSHRSPLSASIVPFVLRSSMSHIMYQSLSTLSNLILLVVWKCGTRCKGMKMLSSTLPPQTAGQWDENAKTEHEILYRMEIHGELNHVQIYLKLLKDKLKIVQGISAAGNSVGVTTGDDMVNIPIGVSMLLLRENFVAK